LTNKKSLERRGKIQLINAVDFCKPAKKSLGSKRNDILPEHVEQIREIYMAFEEGEHCKIFNNKDFGFYQFTIEQPLRDEKGKVKKRAGKPVADGSKRDTENVPLDTNWNEYFATEVLPHIDSESWTDLSKTKIGYEINFTRCFYKFESLEPAEQIADRLNKRMFGDPDQPEKKSIVELFKSLFD
jgi:type I restriction enzyme M protein